MLPNQFRTDWKRSEELILEIELGDLVEIKRPLKNNCGYYAHWVVYIGKQKGVDRVSHISTETSDFGGNKKEIAAKCLSKLKPEVRFDDFLTVIGDDQCRINNSLDTQRRPFPPIMISERSKLKMGTGGYHLLNNNCEHFAKWCRYGIRESDQSLNAKAVVVGMTSMLVTSSVPCGAAIGMLGFLVLKARQRLKRSLTVWSII